VSEAEPIPSLRVAKLLGVAEPEWPSGPIGTAKEVELGGTGHRTVWTQLASTDLAWPETETEKVKVVRRVRKLVTRVFSRPLF
jgi:hypothetical protein